MNPLGLADTAELSDRALWQHMRQSDSDAFTMLVNRHTRPLISYGLQFSTALDAIRLCTISF